MMRKLVRRALAFAVVSLMVLIAFQSVVPKAAAQEEVSILKIGSIEGIDSASPFVGIYDIAWVYYGLVYDCLTTIGKDLEVEPHLAHSWWYMDGTTASTQGIPTDFENVTLFGGLNDTDLWPLGSIWEYNLTENVYWNDGELFTAEDVVWTINTQIGPNFMVYWAYQPYTRWIHHAEKVDDYKVRVFFMDFKTGEPMPIAWGESLFFTIMPKHYFEDFPSTYMAYNWDGYPAIGTGPFMPTKNLINDIVSGESVTLLRNPYYNFVDEDDGVQKGLGAYYNYTMEIDQMLLKFYTEESALSLAVRTGDVHVAKIQPNTYNQWIEDESLPEEVKLVNNLACTSYSKQVCLNAYEDSPGTLNPLRLDPAVQRAAALSINKTLIKEGVYKGLAEEGVGLISPVTKWWWEPPEDEMCTWYLNDSGGGTLFSYTKPMSEVMDYDLALANQILDAAGYEWSGGVGNSVRKATALADARLSDILGTSIGELVGDTLSFEMIIDSTVFEERLIGDYVKLTWREVGIYIDPQLTSAAQW
ncbi:MAG TPA: hypothetical protein ENN25_00380, partial [Euryarchaeota archaeon]|nr:hypothetical protein [Euryarchaeota archaeon]